MQWCYGAPAEKEEETAAEEITDEEAEEILEILSETVEEETPAIEEQETIALPKMVIPKSGTMNFEGDTYDILKTIGVLLGGGKYQGLCSVGGL